MTDIKKQLIKCKQCQGLNNCLGPHEMAYRGGEKCEHYLCNEPKGTITWLSIYDAPKNTYQEFLAYVKAPTYYPPLQTNTLPYKITDQPTYRDIIYWDEERGWMSQIYGCVCIPVCFAYINSPEVL